MYSIPEKYKPGLKQLVELDHSTFSALLDVFKSSPPTIHTEDIAFIAHQKHNLALEDIFDVVEAMFFLYSLQETNNFPNNYLATEISKRLKDELPVEIPEYSISQFKERLLNLLGLRGSLEIAVKAARLGIEHENIFSGSRILTDLRPVFKSDLEDSIGGALISHTLRISYQDISGQKESFFVLDSGDLEQLLEQLERALSKEESLKSLLSKTNISYIDPYPIANRSLPDFEN